MEQEVKNILDNGTIKYQEHEIADHYINAIKTKREEGFTDEQIAKDLSLPLEVVQRCQTNENGGIIVDEPEIKNIKDVLPDNPAEDDVETPIQNNGENTDEKVPETLEGSSETKKEGQENLGKPNIINDKDMYNPDLNIEDIPEDDLAVTIKHMKDIDKLTIEQIAKELNIEEEYVSKLIDKANKIEIKERYTLEDTIQDMLSDDHKKRLKAEYGQTKIRYERLIQYIISVSKGEEEPVESIQLLMIQADAMKTCLTILEVRMDIIAEIQRREEEATGESKETEVPEEIENMDGAQNEEPTDEFGKFMNEPESGQNKNTEGGEENVGE